MTVQSVPKQRLSSTRDSAPWLLRVEDDQPFAYARGRDLYRVVDHARWAYLSTDGWLISARSGRPLAYCVDNVFYDAETDFPVYYET
jgi:hypothetical protein